MTDKTVDNELHIAACHDHAVGIDGWQDGTMFLTVWSPVASREWGRLRWAWQSLQGRWNGETEMVLARESIEWLRDTLTRHLEATDK